MVKKCCGPPDGVLPVTTYKMCSKCQKESDEIFAECKRDFAKYKDAFLTMAPDPIFPSLDRIQRFDLNG